MSASIPSSSGLAPGRTPFVLPPAPISSIRSTTPNTGRAIRSRRNRPCDHCRRAKARCTIDARGPPCLHCSETDRQCTFDAAPPARKPRASTTAPPESMDGDSLSPGHSTRRRRTTTTSHSPTNDRRSQSPPRIASSMSVNPTAAGPSRHSRLPVTELSSFDHLAKSDKYDAHVLTVVLTDDLLPIAEGGDGEDDGRTHVKQISQDPKRPIFVVMDPKPEPFRQPTAGAVALTHIHALLRNHSLHITPAELYELYHKQVHPALPILPQGSTESQFPLLLGSIIATALSHSKRTRELAAPVAGMLEISYAGLGEYNLSGVASAVLDLGMRGVNSSRASYLLLAKTIALAQVLGMHISPKSWAIPIWEQELRIRLWWMLCIHDGWMSFLKSRPSHMQTHNTTIPPADKGALLDAACTFGTASSDSSFAFLTMCELSALVHKLQRTCCTLGSMNRSTIAREDDVKELFKNSEGLLGRWRWHMAGTAERATGVGSMLVHLLGFRCMLMRISLELHYGLSSPFEPDASNFKPFHELVDFVQQLNHNDVDGYWLIYAGHILSSVVSSLIRLSMASPGALNKEAMLLLSRLVAALGRLHSDHGWDIAAPALSRAKLMAGRLKAMNEHEPLVHVLLGTDATPSTLPVDAGLLAEPQQATALGGVEPQMVWDWNGMDFDFGPFSGLLST